jgi:sugar lactone lactonase YvrE
VCRTISAISAIALLTFLPPVTRAQHTISTVAGGIPNNLPGLQVGLGSPKGVFKDSAGNLYISVTADGSQGLYGNVVYKVDSSGQLTTVAGNGTEGFSGDGGPAATAALSGPSGVFVDRFRNIFIADTFNNRIREVVAATGLIQTVAGNGQFGFSGDGGPATSAALDGPEGLFVDRSGNIFIADTSNDRIREVVAATGIIQTVAGNGLSGFSDDGGPATSAALNDPEGVLVDGSGNIFIADTGNQRIRKVLAATGVIQTVAGTGNFGFAGDGGPATNATLFRPSDLSIDGLGNIFIADTNNNRIREVLVANGSIQTVAGGGSASPPFGGDGGPATGASLNAPGGVFVDGSGNIFIADTDNNRIREVAESTGSIRTAAGNGSFGYSGDSGLATGATLNVPSDVYADGSGNLFISDTFNQRIREVVAASGTIQTSAGNGAAGFSGDGSLATSAALHFPKGLSVDSSGNIFTADYANARIREVSASTGTIQTVAGDGTLGFSGDGGPATNAGFVGPTGAFVDTSGNMFIPDNSRIREVVAATEIVQTVAGNGTYGSSGDGGPATSADLNVPIGVYADSSRNIFIADTNNNRIQEVVAATGTIQTVAGNGTFGFSGDGGLATSAQLAGPKGVYVDSLGNLFIADTYNSRIREVDASTGVIQTVAGNGAFGFSGDGGPATSAELDLLVGFSNGIAGDRQGNLFIADESNSRIRRISGLVAVVGITVGSSTPSISPGATHQFTANVTNAKNTSVTWSLSGIGCTDSGCGTITPQGLYTAPSAVANPLSVTVTAISVADNTKSASVTVTVPSSTIFVQPVTPASARVLVNRTRQFTAKVTGTTDTAVIWSISGQGCRTNTACGKVDSSGLYTAPPIVPSPSTFRITATSLADPSKTASATVTVWRFEKIRPR